MLPQIDEAYLTGECRLCSRCWRKNNFCAEISIFKIICHNIRKIRITKCARRKEGNVECKHCEYGITENKFRYV